MSEPKHCIGHICTPYGGAAILVGRYPVGGAIAVRLVRDDDPPGPLAMFSTNLAPYAAALAEDEFCVKTWSENQVLVAPMFATGLFEDTGRRVPSGYAVAPVWRIKDPANVPSAARRACRAASQGRGGTGLLITKASGSRIAGLCHACTAGRPSSPRAGVTSRVSSACTRRTA